MTASVAKTESRTHKPRSRWRPHRRATRDTISAYIFLFVPMILLVGIKFYPVLYNVILSFTNYDLFSPLHFVGLKNYREVFTEDVTLKAIRNTILFTVGAVPIGTALALVVAALLNQPIRGRVVFRTLYYLPVVTSVVASALVWKWIFNPQSGLLNTLIGFVGVSPQQWLYDPRLALPSLIVISLWGGLGGNMVIFLAGLQDIPEAVYEAAAIDGARGWQSFVYVTIPLLRPVILFVVVTYSIAIFRSFGYIYVLTQGGPKLTTNTLVWEVYMNAFSYLRLGKAGAIAMVLLAAILLITLINFRVLREE